MITALITARGGSTRIPGKNIYPICGHPLVAWSIMQALACKQIDRVVLTTDNDEIAEVGERYGAQVVRRPVWENGITAGVAFKHAMDQVSPCDHILTIFPTSPLKKPDDLDNMISLYLDKGVNYMTCATPSKETCILLNEHPYEQRYGETHNTPGDRREDRHFTASLHIIDKFWTYSKLCAGWGITEYKWQMEQWGNSKKLDIEKDTAPIDTVTIRNYYAIEEWQSFDLDYPEDIPIVECFMEHLILKGRTAEEVYRGN